LQFARACLHLLEEAGISEPLRETVRLCTEKRPEDRLQDFSAVCQRLESYLRTVETGEAAQLPPDRRRRVRLNMKWLAAALADYTQGGLAVNSRKTALTVTGSESGNPRIERVATAGGAPQR